MKSVERTLRLVAPKDVNLTFFGESGTGKELLARRAHELSARRQGPFVPINCAAIPEALFESELFGHERGAFTGANARAIGKVESADGGTLFLDEIGEMPLSLQAKLLRFLEGRKFMRVGGAKKIDANVRLMVATLRSLEDDVRAGRFRADLYYRIQGIPIVIPPLRARRTDVAPLLAEFTAQVCRRHGVKPPRTTREAKRSLLAYDWSGNVRELRNVVEMLCLLRAGRTIRPSDLPEAVRGARAASGSGQGPSATTTRIEIEIDDGLDAAVQAILRRALTIEGGNNVRAAARLGISTRTMQRQVARGRASPA